MAVIPANSLKSTGPRTPEGKAASSANAIKTGVYSQATLLPTEDPAEFEAFRDAYYLSFHPADGDERVLLDRMITYAWRLQRLDACYDQMWLRSVENDADSPYRSDTAPLVRPFNGCDDQFEKLQR